MADARVDGEAAVAAADQLDALGVAPKAADPVVVLLPAFDPYVTGSTRQLEKIGAAGHKTKVSRPQGWISPTLVVDGWIRGVWEPADGGRPAVTTFDDLPAKVRKNLDADVTSG